MNSKSEVQVVVNEKKVVLKIKEGERIFEVLVEGGSIQSPNKQYIPLIYQVYIAF